MSRRDLVMPRNGRQNEAITLPPSDASLWDKFDEASTALFAATQTGEPAPRYRTV
jgi:hypothetical protein